MQRRSACDASHVRHAWVAAAIAALVLLTAPSANAYCRAVTASPPAGYDPAAKGCFGYGDGGAEAGAGLYPLFWRNSCVSYSFQKTPSKYLSLADEKRIGALAFGAWSGATCAGGSPSITAVNFPEVDCDSVPSTEHNNTIIFRDKIWPYDDSANAIGYTTLTVDLTSGEILGAVTEINSAQWTIVAEPPAPSNGYDFATIMTHEAGHFLGLAHTGDTSAVMYALYHPGTALQPDDISGICDIYRPDGTHSTGLGAFAAQSCDPRPLQGFLPTSCGSFDAGTVGLMAVGSGPSKTDGLTVACPPDPSGCAASGRTAPWGLGISAAGLVGLATVMRVLRSSFRRKRVRSALGIALALGGAGLAGEHVAHASVSAAVVFDDLVRQSVAVAVVTPIGQDASWEGGRIVTTTRVRVDRLVAGELPGELAVRTQGGSVGRIGQILEGQPTFALGAASLVFLRPHVDPQTGVASDAFVVAAGAQGQFPVRGAAGKAPRLERAPNIGAVVAPPSAPAGVRFVTDVLDGHELEDAARAIAAAFHRLHA